MIEGLISPTVALVLLSFVELKQGTFVDAFVWCVFIASKCQITILQF